MGRNYPCNACLLYTSLPLYLFTLVFVAGPLVYMFVLSFQTRAEVWGVVDQFTLDNYKKIFQPVYLNTFVESVSYTHLDVYKRQVSHVLWRPTALR